MAHIAKGPPLCADAVSSLAGEPQFSEVHWKFGFKGLLAPVYEKQKVVNSLVNSLVTYPLQCRLRTIAIVDAVVSALECFFEQRLELIDCDCPCLRLIR